MTKIDNLTWLDSSMKENFEWSEEDETVREVLWHYFLEIAGNDASRAETLMLDLLNQGDSAIKQLIEQDIKK